MQTQKQIDQQEIDQQKAAFKASGGTVEKLPFNARPYEQPTQRTRREHVAELKRQDARRIAASL